MRHEQMTCGNPICDAMDSMAEELKMQETKTMSKGRYVRLCAVALTGIMLAGCSGKELSTREQTDGERSVEEENAGKRNPEERGTGAENPEEGDGKEGSSEEPDEKASASSYPKVAKLPEDKWFYQVMYSEGCYCIFDGSHYGFMTEEGEEIAPFIYEQAAPFAEELACVCLDGKYGFIGKEGETKRPFIYDQAASFTEGLAYFRIGEDYGFIDHEGKVILRPDCDSVSSFQEGRAYFTIDGLYGYLDQTGRVVAEPVYEDAGYFRNGRARVMRNGRYGLIGTEGEEILPTEYDEIQMEDIFIIAKEDALEYCFDREGRQCLEEGWDRIIAREGMLLVERNGRFGLFDRNGKRLLEPEYDSLYPIPEKELVIVKNNGLYGVMDYAGKEKVPFVYSDISYDDAGAGGLRVTREESYEEEQGIRHRNQVGFLGFTQGDSFAEIPSDYDYLSVFEGDRAVVRMEEKYGIVRRDGSLEYPVVYDSIKLYANGAMAFWTGNRAKLTDSGGNEIYSGNASVITLYGRGYSIREDGKYGFLNEQGESVVPADYGFLSSSAYKVYGADNILFLENDSQDRNSLLIKTDEGEGSGLQKVFLQNHITPRKKEYLDFLIRVEQENNLNLDELDQAPRNLSKLYRMGGELVLYFYQEPYEQWYLPMSNSGFYVFRDGKMQELAAGYECGGTSGGDYICFWYDKAESRVKPGVSEHCEGFGGYEYGGTIYELQGGEAVATASWSTVRQTSRNYDQEDLLKNAKLFYDDYDHPYTRETVLEADIVTEYEVNGKRTTVKRYEEIRDRYRYLNALDLYLD